MKKVVAVIHPGRFEAVKNALTEAGFNGLNVTSITGKGTQRGTVQSGRGGQQYTVDLLPKLKVEVVVSDDSTDEAIAAVTGNAGSNKTGDGWILVEDVTEVVRISTGERGEAAL